MIRKIKGLYVVLSEKTGRQAKLGSGRAQRRRRFGSYKTLVQAKKRLAQVEFFKYIKKSS